MCGIFAYLNLFKKINKNKSLIKNFSRIKHRGDRDPKLTSTLITRNNTLFMGFHRLVINGLTENCQQPLTRGEVNLICNGEIYNYRQLIEENDFDYQTSSDCEIILHMYEKYGIKETCEQLDGVFAFVLYDRKQDELFIARDPIGIRSLYYYEDDGILAVASEAKALLFKAEAKDKTETEAEGFDLTKIRQFPAGHYWNWRYSEEPEKYYDIPFPLGENTENFPFLPPKSTLSTLHDLFVTAVKKRFMSDRPIACLLSGGLDSSLVTALVVKYLRDEQEVNFDDKTHPCHQSSVNTYAIGLKGSTDLLHAKIVADYLGTNHTSIEVCEKDFLDAIEQTIYQIESWDTTTVRASVGNYLVSQYIANHSDDVVIFCGDVSDEVFASYKGCMYAKNAVEFAIANYNLMRDVRYFDVLRSDKSISSAHLEARVPFADKTFVDYVMSLPPKYKMFGPESPLPMEKYILRKAFEDDKLLPDEILWRSKEAFSDGVSHQDRSWFTIIREHVDKLYSDEEFEAKVKQYKLASEDDEDDLNDLDFQENHLYKICPYDKESLYYREIFEKYYPGMAKMIPKFWKQPCTKLVDPSARLL